jgi:NitT/TauT family transport system permease protein
LKRLLINLPNLLFAALVVSVFSPSKNPKVGPTAPFLVVIFFIEALFIINMIRHKNSKSLFDITSILFGVLLIWDILSSKTALANPILFPPPENTFFVFVSHRKMIWEGFLNSMFLLVIGFSLALISAVTLGVFTGWVTRLRNTLFPIVKVLSPIPALVYTPYLIGIMPSFRSASILVIFLGVFWPNLITMISFVGNVDRKIIDSAKSLNVKQTTMLYKIILPYAVPTLIDGLSLGVTFSFMTLTVAEMIGSSSGMGYFVKRFAEYGNYTNVLAGIIFIGIIVTILNLFINILKRKIVKW